MNWFGSKRSSENDPADDCVACGNKLDTASAEVATQTDVEATKSEGRTQSAVAATGPLTSQSHPLAVIAPAESRDMVIKEVQSEPASIDSAPMVPFNASNGTTNAIKIPKNKASSTKNKNHADETANKPPLAPGGTSNVPEPIPYLRRNASSASAMSDKSKLASMSRASGQETHASISPNPSNLTDGSRKSNGSKRGGGIFSKLSNLSRGSRKEEPKQPLPVVQPAYDYTIDPAPGRYVPPAIDPPAQSDEVAATPMDDKSTAPTVDDTPEAGLAPVPPDTVSPIAPSTTTGAQKYPPMEDQEQGIIHMMSSHLSDAVNQLFSPAAQATGNPLLESKKPSPIVTSSYSSNIESQLTSPPSMSKQGDDSDSAPSQGSKSILASLAIFPTQKLSKNEISRLNSGMETDRHLDGITYDAMHDDEDPKSEVASKVPNNEGVGGFLAKCRLVLCGSGICYMLLFAIMATGMAYGVLNRSEYFQEQIDWDIDLNVAFVGNAYLFVNDVPRMMEAISGFHLRQDSVIHTGGSLSALEATGNGMYPKWMTDEAMIEVAYNSNYGGYPDFYDYGLCTVRQLLLGYDSYLAESNGNGYYYDDGHNPCFQVPYYMDFIGGVLENATMDWDYVVLVDQTKRMAFEEARQVSVYSLTNFYGPLLKKTKAVPVIVDTHAFWSDSTNMTGLDDIPSFQALINDGVSDYVSALSSVLPSKQKPRVAPVGLAYLVVWEEDYDLWTLLFMDDTVHSSLMGSYLFGCVLYATIFGHLPPEDVALPENVMYLFSESRKLIGDGDQDYPDYDETAYLREVAGRVVLDGYRPKSLSQ